MFTTVLLCARITLLNKFTNSLWLWDLYSRNKR